MILTEVIKKEGAKWVLYSKDGKKVLGRFDSEAAAKKHEGEVQYFKKNGAEGAVTMDARGVLLVEDYHINPSTPYEMMQTKMIAMCQSLTDERLREIRDEFVKARTKLYMQFKDLGEDRYVLPAGRQILADIFYYDRVISALECEMACRLLTL